MTQRKELASVSFLLAILLLSAGCCTQPIETRKETRLESQLYIEVIKTQDGKHRFGIVYPTGDKGKMESAEVDLPPDGIAHPINLNGHKITVFCRYRREGPNKEETRRDNHR